MSASKPSSSRVLLTAGAVCGIVAGITVPWHALSSFAFAAAAVLWGIVCFPQRKSRKEFSIAWITAAVTAALFIVNAFVQPGGNAELTLSMFGVLGFYYHVMHLCVGSIATARKLPEHAPAPEPPRVCTLFEYCIGVFAIGLLAQRMLPEAAFLAQLVSMAAATIGFSLMMRFFQLDLSKKPQEQEEEIL